MILKPFRVWNKLASWQQILIALALGIIAGLVFGKHVAVLQPFGNLFINAIHMLVVPVVFVSITCAVLSTVDNRSMSRITLKAFLVYAISMAIAAAIGLTVASVIQPGQNFHPMISITEQTANKQLLSFTGLVENLIPRNPIQAFAQENVLQIVIFSLIFGFSIKMAGKTAEPVVNFMQSLLTVVFKLAHIVIGFAPYGIFALIAWTFGTFGLDAIVPLLKLILCVIVGCFLQMVIVYMGGLFFLARYNPISFFKGIFTAIAFAFTTSSSAATLPVSISCAEENLNIKPEIAGYLLPLGASFNLNGLSIYLSAATIFAANIYGVHLGLMDCVALISTIILTAMGAAAIPGSALIVMGAAMSSVGLPLGAIALIAGVDRLNDMIQTATNVTGDLFACLFVAKGEDKAAISASRTQ